MGSQTECTVRFGRQTSAGVAYLESEALIFRGDFRLSIAFKDLSAVDAEGGELRLEFPGGSAILELGPVAEKWAAKIRKPKGLLDKLGVKPDDYVAVLGIKDESFLQQIRTRTRNIARGPPRRELDLIFLAIDSRDKLNRLDRLQNFLKPEGAIWVVWPKGRQEIKESDVIAAGKDAGLVDVKVAKFSESHSALKLIIPLARRRGR